MERQNRLLTVLATVLLVLVAIVVFVKPEEDATTDPEAPPERALLEGLDAATAQSLTVVRPDGELAFTKRDGTWAMTRPREMAVDQRRVEEILERFADLKVEEKGFAGDLAGFGLDAASRITVEIGAGDGKTRKVYVGRDAPVGYRSYVAEGEAGPALLAASKVGDLLRRGADDFRSREVWQVSSGTAHRIRIESAGTAVVLRKDVHGWWLGDEGPRASDRAVEDWLSTAGLLRADSFLDDGEPAALGLAPPTSRVTVEDDAGTHVLEVGTSDASGVVARSGTQIVRMTTELPALVKIDGWVSEALMPVRRAQVDAIEVKLGARTVNFVREDGLWKGGDGKDAPAAEALLGALYDAVVDRSGPVADVGATWGTVTLSEGATRKETVTVGAELPAGGRAARDAAGGPAFRIPTETLAAIEATLP